MAWIWLSSNVKKYIKEIVDRQAHKVYKALRAQIKRQLMDAIDIDLRDAIRIEVKRATQDIQDMKDGIKSLEEYTRGLGTAVEFTVKMATKNSSVCPEGDIKCQDEHDLNPNERIDHLENDLGALITNIAETLRVHRKDIDATSEVLSDAVDAVNENSQKIDNMISAYNQAIRGMVEPCNMSGERFVSQQKNPYLTRRMKQEAEKTQQEEEMEEMKEQWKSMPASVVKAMVFHRIQNNQEIGEELREAIEYHGISLSMFAGARAGVQ